MRAMSGVLRETVRPHTMKRTLRAWRFSSAGRFSSASLPL